MPRAAAIRRLPRDGEDTSFSPPARRTRLALARRAEQEAAPFDETLPEPAPRRARGRPRNNDRQPGSPVVRASSNSNSASASVVRSRGAPASAAVANVRALGTTSGTSVRSVSPFPALFQLFASSLLSGNLQNNVPSQRAAIPARLRAGQPAAGSGVVNRRTPEVSASRRGASNSVARSNRAPTAASAAGAQRQPVAAAQRQPQVFANAAPAADVAQSQRQPAVDATATQHRPPVAAAQSQPQRQPQVVANVAQGQAQVPDPVSTAPPARPQNRPANLPQIVPPVVPAVVAQQNAPAPNNPVGNQALVAAPDVAVVQQPIVASVRIAAAVPAPVVQQPVAASAPLPNPGAVAVVVVAQQPNGGVATNNSLRAAVNVHRGRAEQLPAPAVPSRIQVADTNAGPALLHVPRGQPMSMLLQIHPRSAITVREAAAYFADSRDAVKELRAAVDLARQEDPRKSAVRVQVFPPAPDAEAEAAGTRTPAVETLVFDSETLKDLPETVQGFVGRHAPNLLVRITVIKGRAAIPESPMPKRDDTVIRSDDWGDCTICFEDLPYDPVGCLYCRQMIGCRFCVKQWIRSGREAAAAHPNNPEAGRNHRQCPLCRHEWDWEPEVTSMFVLRGGA